MRLCAVERGAASISCRRFEATATFLKDYVLGEKRARDQAAIKLQAVYRGMEGRTKAIKTKLDKEGIPGCINAIFQTLTCKAIK